MPTFLNGIQVVIKFNWILMVDFRLHKKRFVSQARQTPHSREALDKREARCVQREKKKAEHIWQHLC